MGQKEDRAELRERANRLRMTYEHLNQLHEELRMITENLKEQTRTMQRELAHTRKMVRSGVAKRARRRAG